jgi:transposase-like protein
LLNSNRYIEVKNPPKVWLVDDSVVKIRANKFRLFVVLGYTERVVLAWYLAPTKDKEVAKKVLNLALSFVKEKPSIIVSDFAQVIEEATKEIFGGSVLHVKVRLFKNKGCFSNNRLERFFSTIKERFKLRKQPKSFLSAKLQILIIITIYNLTLHNSVGKAPIEKIAHIKKIPYFILGVIKCFV